MKRPKNINNNLVKNDILGVLFTNATSKGILELVFLKIKNSNERCYVVTPNPEMIVAAQKDKEFLKILNNATISLCDGIGVFLASRILGVPLLSRLTGVDALRLICSQSVKEAVTIAFLGGKKGVADKAAECLRRENPGLRIIFTTDEWKEKYNTIPVDILFIAFGFPKQERWINDHLNEIPVKMMMGVGGSFDYLSGSVPRAPLVIRTFGLEWLFRLIRQPWRWRRQLSLIEFIWLVIKAKVNLK